VTIARTALWPDFPAVKETFQTTDYEPATGTLIFNLGGNRPGQRRCAAAGSSSGVNTVA